MSNVKVALVPLDDRPCNLRFPVQLGKIAGWQVMTPPREMLGGLRAAGDCENVLAWFCETGTQCERAIVALDMMCYGGLVASRTPMVPVSSAIIRLDRLKQWRAQHHPCGLYAFNVIMRLSITVDSDTASEYYATLIRYAQAADRAEYEADCTLFAEAEELRKQIPPHILENCLRARERNHRINQLAVEYVKEGIFDYLILCQEDAAQYGFHRKEQGLLRHLIDRLHVEDCVHIYPGADEAACTLLARHVLQSVCRSPKVRVVYSQEDGADRIPPFEDRPLRECVSWHLRSCGVSEVLTDSAEEDFFLFVNVCETCSRAEAAARRERGKHLHDFVAQITSCLEANRMAAVADVAFPNGGDSVLVELLLKRVPVAQLLSYGGWNTAGNTLGTVISHAVLRWVCLQRLLATGLDADTAHAEFLFERFIDDWAFQSVVRRELEDTWARARGASIFDLREHAEEAEQFVRERLAPYVHHIYDVHFAPQLPCNRPLLSWSVTLPWKRTFEVDFRAGFPGHNATELACCEI